MKQQNDAQSNALWKFIKELGRSGLTTQQIKTIRGQALAGDIEGAQKGYQRLMRAKHERMRGRAM